MRRNSTLRSKITHLRLPSRPCLSCVKGATLVFDVELLKINGKTKDEL